MKRREIFKLSAAGLSFLALPSSALTKPADKTHGHNKKLIWILLRGGMDGLQSTVPLFDSELMTMRKDLVMPIKDQLLPLKRNFAFHPQLKFMHKLFKAKQLNSIVATATGYRERSHFAAQDYMESGLSNVDTDNGWLARALIELNNNSEQKHQALAIARSLPIAMRGTNNEAITWYPSVLPNSNDDLHERLLHLYKDDEALHASLTQAIETQKLVGNNIDNKKKLGKLPYLAKACAKLMTEPTGPAVAMLEMGGWDTHSNQVNRLNKRFNELDTAIETLHTELGNKVWQDTLLVVTSEFGRTVKINGTGGTDHGTATNMFIAGGAINGGNVLGKWPGLAKEKQYQKRDLQPTSNTFDWIAKSLVDHWQLSPKQINRIFLDS